MPYIKVSLVADQVAILIGMADIYSKQYIQHLEEKVKLATSVGEVDDLIKAAMGYTQAKLELDKALCIMLEEGESREAFDNKEPYEVLFTSSEHKFLTGVLGRGTLDRASPAATTYSEAEIAKAEALIQATVEALRGAVEVTEEQMGAIKAQTAKTAPKTDAELTKGFFVQTKTGLA